MNLTGRGAIAVLAALVISLSLNFVWLGFFAAGSLRKSGPEISAERLVSLGARSLPPELRSQVAAVLKPRGDEIRNAFRDIRNARIAVFDAMRADPLDSEAVKRAFANLRDKSDSLAAIGQDSILTALESAPPSLRAAIQPPSGNSRPKTPGSP